MKVVLVETTSKPYRTNPFRQMARILEPLAVEYIGGYLRSCGNDVEIIQQLAMDGPELAEQIVSLHPDVAAFSCMTYSYPETSLIAQTLKRESPQIQTILGGYHVLGMESAPAFFDFVIRGEGEIATERVLAVLRGDADIADIPGLLYCRGRRWEVPLERTDIARLPLPLRLPRKSFQSMSLGENLPGIRLACVLAGRGCPYHCDFCCTPQLFPGRRVLRPTRDVVAEIIQLRDEMGVTTINLRDETFTPDRAYVVAFCEEMIRQRSGVSWRAFANIGNVTPELLALMAEAGCHMLFYGVEASDPETLRKRRKNFRHEERIIADVRATQAAGIYVRAGIIVGHEADSAESVAQQARFLRDLCPDELYISFLTPFPGTPLYRTMKDAGRLLTTDFSRYDCEHPVIDIGIAEDELKRLRLQLYRGFYLSPQWTTQMTDHIRRQPERRETIQRFAEFVSHQLEIPNPLVSSPEGKVLVLT